MKQPTEVGDTGRKVRSDGQAVALHHNAVRAVRVRSAWQHLGGWAAVKDPTLGPGDESAD